MVLKLNDLVEFIDENGNVRRGYIGRGGKFGGIFVAIKKCSKNYRENRGAGWWRLREELTLISRDKANEKAEIRNSCTRNSTTIIFSNENNNE